MSAVYKRVILVTGSNTGIGLDIVRSLAEKGHTVYLSARNAKAGLDAQSQLKADGLSVKFVQLDVTSTASVVAAKDVIEKAEGHLDTVVNNAGISCLAESAGPLKESLANIQATFDTNLLGLVRVAQAFVPLLRRAPPARRASSRLHQAVSYNTSKAAANSYIIALAKELEGEVKTPRQAADVIVPWALLGPEDKNKTCLFWSPNGEFAW
ncbi:hypothetical protein CPB85DRAFT_1451836 [Mucidula mucida]|nr:hypothetical protein CPB85DRAFT_1451836 [Mucidula mucida]